MSFQPEVNQELVIDGVTYRIAEHPAAPGIPYGQEGRAGIVYQLAVQDGEKRALKVFKARYRLPALVSLADELAPFAELPGLQVCQRTVPSTRRHEELLRQYPDLNYAVLMPWIEGPTWMEILVEKRGLAPEQSLALARRLAQILAGMEECGLAHCDLSGPNVLLPGLPPSPSIGRGVGGEGLVALVDLEQLYGPGLEQPRALPGGSPGYAHRTAPEGLWGLEADRFAGAVLLGEVLGWCDQRVQEMAWGENYFDPQEMQQNTDREHTLVNVLREQWGHDVTLLFERAWYSETLADCPTFGEWLVALPQGAESVPSVSVGVGEEQDSVPDGNAGGDEATGPGGPSPEDSVAAIYQVLRAQVEQGAWEQAERTAQAIELLQPDYRDVPMLLRQVQDNRAGRQEADELYQRLDAETREEEERLSRERAALDGHVQALASERSELEGREATLAQQRSDLQAQLASIEQELTALASRRKTLEEQVKEAGRPDADLRQQEQKVAARRAALAKAQQLLIARQYQEARLRLRTMLGPTVKGLTEEQVAKLKVIRRLEHRKGGLLAGTPAVTSVAFCPLLPDIAKPLLASGNQDGRICLWHVRDGTLFRILEQHTGQVWSIAFSPDGRILASGSQGGGVKLWNVTTGQQLPAIKWRANWANVAFSPDGVTLALGLEDGTIQLWRVSDGIPLCALRGHTKAVNSVAFSPDGTTLASGSDDRTVRLWQVNDGTLLRTLGGHTDRVHSVAFSPGGSTLASGSRNSRVLLWRCSDGTRLWALKGTARVNSVAFSPDGKILAVGAQDSLVRLYRVANGSRLCTLKGHSSSVLSVAFSPDGTMLASGSEDSTVRLWGVRD